MEGDGLQEIILILNGMVPRRWKWSVYNVDEDIYNERRVESRGHRLPW